jgi:hypothetical protein
MKDRTPSNTKTRSSERKAGNQPLSKDDKELMFWMAVFLVLGYICGLLDRAGIPLGGFHH